MKFISILFIILLCIFQNSCPHLGIDIDIGDYDYHLEMWNNQNMLDYQLEVYFRDNISKQAIISIKNGIPESSDPSSWIVSNEKSTVPDFFFFIKDEEEKINNESRASLFTAAGYFIVRYDNKYHYPMEISFASRTTHSDQSADWIWRINLIPAEDIEHE